jgi:hypothetical protein
MKKKLTIMLIAMFGMALQGKAQSSVEEQANRIGLPGFWKMVHVTVCQNGETESYEQDGSIFYIIKKDGTAQYATTNHKIANARWTLKGDSFHFWGNDKLNDPNGTDYTYKVVMVTPEKMVLKLEDDEMNYLYVTFRKSNSSLQSTK